MVRGHRDILRGTAVAAVASGAPSSLWALAHGHDPLHAGLEATRAIGTLLPGGAPGLIRGAIAHGVVSLAVGGGLGVVLPRRRSLAWGAAGGLAVGWVNLAVIARRRYPAVAALALGPQLADNVAFGVIFAAAADRGRVCTFGRSRDREVADTMPRSRAATGGWRTTQEAR